jgi:hypothetical protein
MKVRRLIAAVLFGTAFLSGLFLPAQQPAEKVEVKTIPLETGYTTSDQKALKHVRRQGGDDLNEIFRKAQGMGASNVFLVRGEDIADAVFHTRSVFVGYRSANVPVGPVETKQFWLVAYFGLAGSGEAWVVKSIEQKGKTIRLTYEVGQTEAGDTHQYFAWVPLGNLEPGRYTLELSDAQNNEVNLMRRIIIGK